MKTILNVSLVFGMLTSASSFALPVPSHEAIQGLLQTASFKRTERNVISALRYYDQFSVKDVDRSDAEMMAACYPSGFMSRSSTTLRVTFTNSYESQQVVKFFTTSEKPSDFGPCQN